jgi:glucuronoarabinoxylan endo-1,4-beta-xylanase
MWAQIVNNRMAVANASAWNYWMLIGHYRVNDNEGLIGPDGVTVSKRAYMLGNYSRFVRPGFYRIDATATPQEGVLSIRTAQMFRKDLRSTARRHRS